LEDTFFFDIAEEVTEVIIFNFNYFFVSFENMFHFVEVVDGGFEISCAPVAGPDGIECDLFFYWIKFNFWVTI